MRLALIHLLIRRSALAALVAIAWSAAPAPAQTGPGPGDLTLRAGLTILVDPAEPAPVRRAVDDLARDCEKVLGARPAVVGSLDAVTAAPGDSAPPVIVVTSSGPATANLRRPDVRGWEAHALFVGKAAGRPCVVLQGADARGAIYAIYTFSDRVLGIPPLWYWASWKVQRRERIIIPGDFALSFAAPYVRWRAWFPNDQDLLTTWERNAEEKQNALYEAMLRLKMNVLDIGAIRDYPRPSAGLRKARAATAYGLAVTGTHTSPMAASLGDWDAYWRLVRKQEPPAVTLANADKFEEFWEYHIRLGLREKLEMIWMIGFRGAGDVGFFEAVADAPRDDAARAQAIEGMMRRQVALLKRVTGQAHPLMRTVLYNENSYYFAAGLFRPPDEPSLIWNFCSARRDHYPAADVRGFHPGPDRAIGYYLNFQFTSSGSHLAQGEGPWKMERNYRMVQAVGPRPLEFSVVNMGNIREFLLEASANAAMLWDFAAYDTDRFLQDFTARYFGAEHGPRVAELYRRFYDSYWRQRKPTLPGFERQFVVQDMRLARASERLLAQLPKGYDPNPLQDGKMDAGGRYFNIVPAESGAANQIEAILSGVGESIQKLSAVIADAEALRPGLPETGRAFFSDNLLVQARFLREDSRTLLHLAQAMAARRDNDRPALRAQLADAGKSAAAMREVLRAAEHDQFEAWYDGDRVFGMAKLLDRIKKATLSIK